MDLLMKQRWLTLGKMLCWLLVAALFGWQMATTTGVSAAPFTLADMHGYVIAALMALMAGLVFLSLALVFVSQLIAECLSQEKKEKYGDWFARSRERSGAWGRKAIN